MTITCSWGSFLTAWDGIAYTRLLYSLVQGKVAKITINMDVVWVIDNGGPTETAFLNNYPKAIKVTEIVG